MGVGNFVRDPLAIRRGIGKYRREMGDLFGPAASCWNPPHRIILSEGVIIDPPAIRRAGWGTIGAGRDQRVGLFPVGIHSPYRGAAETTGAIHNRAAIRTYRRSREEAKLGIGRDLPWFPAGLSQPELARSAGERRIEHAAVLRPLQTEHA